MEEGGWGGMEEGGWGRGGGGSIFAWAVLYLRIKQTKRGADYKSTIE